MSSCTFAALHVSFTGPVRSMSSFHTTKLSVALPAFQVLIYPPDCIFRWDSIGVRSTGHPDTPGIGPGSSTWVCCRTTLARAPLGTERLRAWYWLQGVLHGRSPLRRVGCVTYGSLCTPRSRVGSGRRSTWTWLHPEANLPGALNCGASDGLTNWRNCWYYFVVFLLILIFWGQY